MTFRRMPSHVAFRKNPFGDRSLFLYARAHTKKAREKDDYDDYTTTKTISFFLSFPVCLSVCLSVLCVERRRPKNRIGKKSTRGGKERYRE